MSAVAGRGRLVKRRAACEGCRAWRGDYCELRYPTEPRKHRFGPNPGEYVYMDHPTQPCPAPRTWADLFFADPFKPERSGG